METLTTKGLFYATSLFIIISFAGVEGACNANSLNKITFQEIPEADWDSNWSDISEDGKRPLGFQKGTVYFNSPSKPNPCIEVSDTNGRHIQILVESPTGNIVWFKNQDGAAQRCQKTASQCPLATASSMYYEFYLDTSGGSSESDVNFWYKFTRGPPNAEDSEGMWCDGQQAQYPSSLQPIPTNLVPRQSTKGPAGSAGRVHISTALFSVLLLFACWVLQL